MPPTDTTPRVLPPAWADVLERIRKAVGEAVAEAEYREQALEAAPANYRPAVDRAATWHGSLGRLQERLEHLEAVADRAKGNADRAQETIAAAEELLRRWLQAGQAVGQMLAERTSPGVG
jgi:hypothetical protein